MHKHASKPFGSKLYGSLEIAPFFQLILPPGNSFPVVGRPRDDVDRGELLTYLHTSRMENSSDASSQSSLDTSYGTSHTSLEVSMEYELSHFADDSRFDQVSHETDHEAEYTAIYV